MNEENRQSQNVDIPVCKVCGEETKMVVLSRNGLNPLLANGIVVRRKCKCEREEQARLDAIYAKEALAKRISELKSISLMDSKFSDVRFSNLVQNAENEKAITIARNYVEKFEDMYEKSQGLLFYGEVGVGKSCISAAIANELIEKQNMVLMTSFIKLLQESSVTFDDSSYISKLNKSRLVIIDDFGAERGTDYALEKVYNIIDTRYRSGKPLIITSNVTIEEMMNCTDIRYNRIYDRIFEMCYPVKIDGMSWRKKQAVSRFEEMKKTLEE